MAISPLIHYFVCKLGNIIDVNGWGKTDSLRGFAPPDGRIGQKQWACVDILIDNDENAEGAAVGQPIVHKVQRSEHVRSSSQAGRYNSTKTTASVCIVPE